MIRRDWTAGADSKGINHDVAAPSTDLVLSAEDSVTFQVHRARLLAASTNGFNAKLPTLKLEESDVKVEPHVETLILDVPYSSAVVNILLHAVYKEDGLLRVEIPSLTDIYFTICALKEYGIPCNASFSDTSLLFGVMAAHCQTSPLAALEVYALAAAHAPDLHHIAVYSSRFLLPLEFARITDEIAVAMGSVYLFRLSQLLVRRTQQFKRLLLPPPQLHEPSSHCDTRVLREAWTLMTAFLMWYAAPEVKDAVIDDLKDTIIDRIQCKRCREMLEQRLDTLKRAWALVKCTI
ncbi:hypothetical protein SCHPADRAFT_898449 [Schizopora paradoxa]|uniref:BTB domain-containing protein n=1 Tax=Schizopora paradoxa TaxID=27342 RepID=A0A0H2S7D4_9AGAM|nr:hypothetical protein SCHPADRAFT_898449 [Schizopora paradoxa]